MKKIRGRMDESILVCVFYGPNGERLISRGHRLASMLDCPAKVIAEVAHEFNITQIIIGQTARSRWEEITKGSFLNMLLREIPFVDLHVVSVARTVKGVEGDEFEKGVRYYLVKDGDSYKINFTQSKNCQIEGIFFKEIGTDFDNGIFKFMHDNKLYQAEVTDDRIDLPEIIDACLDKELVKNK